MDNKKKMVIVIIALLVVIIALIVYKKVINKDPEKPIDNPIVNPNKDFDSKVIYETNNLVKKENYLISPLSMGFALSLLNEGADGNTKSQIDSLLNGYTLTSMAGVKNKIGIANLLFVRNQYKDDISNDYISTLQNKYDSDVMFDEFATAKKANDWISEKTYKMIPEAIGELSPDFVLGIANTIAIDIRIVKRQIFFISLNSYHIN